MTQLRSFLPLGLIFTALSALAQNPFVGNWKLNVPKDHFTGETFEFAPAPGGAIRYTALGLPPETFKPDGSKYPGPLPQARNVWKQLDDHTLQCTTVWGGESLPSVKTWKLSADGSSVNYDDLFYLPVNFHKVHTNQTYLRIAPGNGLMGSWKHPMRTAADMPMSWKPAGPNAIQMDMDEAHATMTLPLDGKQHPSPGAAGAFVSMAATRTGARSFTMTHSVQGRQISKTIYTVSDDGRTLTATVTPSNGAAPETSTYTNVR